MFTLHIPHSLRLIAWFWGLLYLLAATVSAQPISTCCMAYTTIDENTFYVLGGTHYQPANDSNYSNNSVSYPTQFYSLDLTQTGWNTSTPPWKELTYPSELLPLSTTPSAYSIAVAPDSRTFSVWGLDTLVNYNISGDYWTPVTLNNTGAGSGLRAVTDPTTGLVYIPGGGMDYSTMLVYDPVSNSMNELPNSEPLGGPYYTFVWSNIRNSFIYFTGNNSTANPFSEYKPSTRQWSKLVIVRRKLVIIFWRSCSCCR